MLRPFSLADAPMVQRLAGDREIAATTANIPHPYPDGAAEEWIGSHAGRFQEGVALSLAITLRSSAELIGAIGLELDLEHLRAELGYWVGRPYWGNGYCTDAARLMLDYGFDVLGLNRIQARHFSRNPASGRVMQKIGMRREGCLREYVRKWGQFEDIVFYAVLRLEYRAAQPVADSS